jgi:hypothetical protein
MTTVGSSPNNSLHRKERRELGNLGSHAACRPAEAKMLAVLPILHFLVGFGLGVRELDNRSLLRKM